MILAVTLFASIAGASNRFLNVGEDTPGNVARVTIEDLARGHPYSFEQYKVDFSKKYGSQAEETLRRGIFEKNLQSIRNHNAKGKMWKMHVNHFTDLHREEFRNVTRGFTRVVEPPNMVALNASQMSESNSDLETITEDMIKNLPKSVDWRKEGILTSAKQQSACGSCWAFSATETLEAHLAIAMKSQERSNPRGESFVASNFKLAPQQLLSCAPNPEHCGGTGGCQGSTQALAYKYLKESSCGLSLEEDYEYTAETDKCRHEKIKPAASLSGYVELPKNDYWALMHAVATKGPIAVSVDATFWQSYYAGIFNGINGKCGWRIDHAVQLVGYGENHLGVKYWIIRNSWGNLWGENGYMYLRRHEPQPGQQSGYCGTDDQPLEGFMCEGQTAPIKVCGMCGVLSNSAYPTGVHLVSKKECQKSS